MKILLAGQRSFGLAAYRAIQEAGHDIVGVWSPPMPEDKLSMQAARDKTFMDTSCRTPLHVRNLGVDLIVAAHSHDFISRPARAAAKLGGIGYHPSLLPRHRGRDAVRWAVHMGDAITGGSVYWLTDNVDGGPVAAQDWCFVPQSEASWDAGAEEDEVVSDLWRNHLFPMGIRLILKVLDDLHRGYMIEVPQDERFATWEPSWERPPLFRPDLPQLGSINGFKHVTTRKGVSDMGDRVQ